MARRTLSQCVFAVALAAAVAVNGLLFSAFGGNRSLVPLNIRQIRGAFSNNGRTDGRSADNGDETAYSDDEMVRVSIILNEKPAVDSVGELKGIADNAAAMSCRRRLREAQEKIASEIEKATGEKLDVVWNLTLAANLISANVKYGQLETIKKVGSVKNVIIEKQYSTLSDEEQTSQSITAASVQTGTGEAWSAGYTGAGIRIAVIDTGIAADHISFDNDSYLYSLEQNAKKAGMTLEGYKKSLGLLTKEEIERVKDRLNAGRGNYSAENAADGYVDAEQAYLNEKLPFIFDYTEHDYDVAHTDGVSTHGSHIAGIAAANSYVKCVDGAFRPALEAVHMQGGAPDAQLIVLKVFGANNTEFESDRMAALEDALILNADVVNISISSFGMGNSGSFSSEYDELFDELSKKGLLVTASAGNSGAWQEATANGKIYADDINFQTATEPGTFDNALSIASVNNIAMTADSVFTSGEKTISYSDSSYYNVYLGQNISSFKSLSGRELRYVLLDETDGEGDFSLLADELKGNIAVARFSETCGETAVSAVENGAVGVVFFADIANAFGICVKNYTHTAPVVVIPMADGDFLRENGEKHKKTVDGKVLEYYTGTLSVKDEPLSGLNDASSEMSAFSSWGVPGSLKLKPELTAPGGRIYSVNGETADEYVYMSGTSMAAPQTAAMSALLYQYIRENGLDGGINIRALSQSLLMSTAKPLKEKLADESGGFTERYYPVIRQGAGLANVSSAISAKSYILMGADATSSYADGKIKAEIGDDPQRNGRYSFTFSVNSINGEAETYDLSADLFTQDIELGEDGLEYLSGSVAPLEFEAEFKCDGNTVRSVTVPANGSAVVEVTLTLKEAEKERLDRNYDNGAYIEGFVFVSPNGGAAHSIPILGFYGCWTDASMFDVGSHTEYIARMETREPYFGDKDANAFKIVYAGAPENTHSFGGNPVAPDEEYFPERNAMNSSDIIRSVEYIPIRNAVAARFTASGGGKASADFGVIIGANAGNRGDSKRLDFIPGKNGFVEGDSLTLCFTAAPEYYKTENGDIRWDELGKGAAFSVSAIIDDTAPIVEEAFYDRENHKLVVTASDNNYVAGVTLISGGEDACKVAGAKADAERGTPYRYELDLDGVTDRKFIIRVTDYANNSVIVECDADKDIILPVGTYWLHPILAFPILGFKRRNTTPLE